MNKINGIFPVLDTQCRTFVDGATSRTVRDQFIFLDFETYGEFDMACLDVDGAVYWSSIKVRTGTYSYLSRKYGLSVEAIRRVIARQIRRYKNRITNKYEQQAWRNQP